MKLIDLNERKADQRADQWAEEWASAAKYLRELADRFEKGEITEAVLVFNDKENRRFESFGHFEDRWRILGALESAKAAVCNN